MDSTEIIQKFIGFLAEMQSLFRDVAIYAQKYPPLHDVSTQVMPCKGGSSPWGYGGNIISIALNAELRKPIDPEHQAIGMSLLLRHSDGYWIVEAEVGWTGRMVGWDQFAEKVVQSESIEDVMNDAPNLVLWMESEFKAEVEKLPV